MSFSETIFLFFLALVIFGPKKLPEIARQAGKLLNEFRRASNEFKSQIEQEISHLEVETKRAENQPTILSPSPAPAGTESRTLNTASSGTNGTEAVATDVPATLDVSDDEPLFATKTPEPPVATEALPADESVTSPTSQESHA